MFGQNWTVGVCVEDYNIILFIKTDNVVRYKSGLSLRAGGRGFSPATKREAPGYFYWKIKEK